MPTTTVINYSHISNKRGDWNKRGGGAKVAKSLNVKVGINKEGGIIWKKLVHNSNKHLKLFNRNYSTIRGVSCECTCKSICGGAFYAHDKR